MKAIALQSFGGPEVLQVVEFDRPAVGPGELLVRVVCAGTNPVDSKMRQNGGAAGLKPPVIPGYDVSGVVEEVGSGVVGFERGDEVYYMAEIIGNARGSYAEYNVVPATIVARKPRTLSHEEAAAVPLAAGTAWEGIVRRMRVQPGETVLIHGGAGGVGSFAVQLARAAGARVLATASAPNQEAMRELGADVTIDYAKDDPAEVALSETGGRGVDATFDTVGGDLVAKSIRATKSFGRLACILTPGGTLAGISSRNQTLYGIFILPEAERLRQMAELIDRGEMRPLIDRVIPLEEAREAHERLDTGHGRGKLVLRVGEA